MNITAKDLHRFFPDDNRYLHYVAKINGFHFKNQDDVEEARHNAIVSCMRLVNNNIEVEDEAHLVRTVTQNFKWSILKMFKSKLSQKAQLKEKIDTESAKFDIDDLRTLDTYHNYTFEYDNSKEVAEKIAKDILPEDYLSIFEQAMKGYSISELAKAYDITPNGVRSRLSTIAKKIKSNYENEPTTNRKPRKPVQSKNRDLPVTKYSETSDAYTTAMSFLYPSE